MFFNSYDLKLDFHYIDDIVQGILNMFDRLPQGADPTVVYNIGNNHPADLLHFVETLETASCQRASSTVR